MSKKLRMLAIGALTTATLSIPAVTAATAVTTHVAKHDNDKVKNGSHRLAAGTVKNESLRLV